MYIYIATFYIHSNILTINMLLCTAATAIIAGNFYVVYVCLAAVWDKVFFFWCGLELFWAVWLVLQHRIFPCLQSSSNNIHSLHPAWFEPHKQSVSLIIQRFGVIMPSKNVSKPSSKSEEKREWTVKERPVLWVSKEKCHNLLHSSSK